MTERSTDRGFPLQVFLCHSSGDKQAVLALYGKLKADLFAPWLDEKDILPGQEWDSEIRRAVRASDVVVVCLSSSSITKEGYVQKEIRHALDVADEKPAGAIYVIPARLDACEVPERLRRWHWVNLFESGGYERLVAALRNRESGKGPRPGLPPRDGGNAASTENTPSGPAQSGEAASVEEKTKSVDKPFRFGRRAFYAMLILLVVLAGGGFGFVQYRTVQNAEFFNQGKKHYAAGEYAEAIPLLRRAAQAGYSQAQNLLGDAYSASHGVEQDYGKSLEWYSQSAAARNSDAADNLGDIYYYGNKVVPQSYKEARKWYEKAAAQGNSAAMSSLGLIYRFGYGVPADFDQARYWFEKAANKGSVDALSSLGRLYVCPCAGGKQDVSIALHWYEKALAAGDADAANEIGDIYYNGNGVPQDYAKAAAYYSRAPGNRSALFALGYLNDARLLKNSSASKAAEFYQKAADLGAKGAMFNLAAMYYKGVGVDKDPEAARKWYQSAADLGDPDAMFNVADMYLRGEGGDKDSAAARKWFHKAADLGDAVAMYNMAIMNYNGQGDDKDYAAARAWYKKAAAAGYSEANARLKEMDDAKQ